MEMLKVGDVVTIAVGRWGRIHLRIAHTTTVMRPSIAGFFFGAAANTHRRGRKVVSWSDELCTSEEGLRWIRGAHARNGEPTTAAGRALLTAYTLRTA